MHEMYLEKLRLLCEGQRLEDENQYLRNLLKYASAKQDKLELTQTIILEKLNVIEIQYENFQD